MIEPVPCARFSATVAVPGSKYIANRLLFIAALADGVSVLSNVPENDDLRAAVEGLAAFGIRFEKTGPGALRIHGCSGRFSPGDVSVFTAGSGTFSRFLVPFAALSGKKVSISANAKMSARPMGPVFQAVRELGASVAAEGDHLPALIQGPVRGGSVAVDGSISSQYFSALMLSGITPENLEVRVVGNLVSGPFVHLTADLMRQGGVVVDLEEDGSDGKKNIRAIRIRGGQHYRAASWAIEPDPVSASYFMAAAALTGGQCIIPAFNPRSPQGESLFPEILERMGCRVRMGEDGLTVDGPQEALHAVDVDMGDMPDAVQTLCACAAFAEGVTRIRGIGHLVHKESDRIHETAREMGKLGIEIEASPESLTIRGAPSAKGLHGAAVDACGDHRMAMSLALLGLRIPGVKVGGHQAVEKSFPDFFERLEKAGVSLLRG